MLISISHSKQLLVCILLSATRERAALLAVTSSDWNTDRWRVQPAVPLTLDVDGWLSITRVLLIGRSVCRDTSLLPTAINSRLNSASTECHASVEITSDIAVSAYSRQFATQLNVLSQLFRTAGKSSRKTHAFDTNFFSYKLRNNEAKSPLNDADFVRLSTSLSLFSANAVITEPSLTRRLRRRAAVSSSCLPWSHRYCSLRYATGYIIIIN